MAFSADAFAQIQTSVFNLLQDAHNSLRESDRDVKNLAPVNESALDSARQALKQSFDSPLRPSPENWIYIAGESERIAQEFIRESQIKAEQRNWLGAMNSRLDAVELAVKLEATSHWAGNAGGESKVEAAAMENIYAIASRLDAISASLVASRLDAIEAERPLWIDLLERNRAENLRSVEDYIQQPDWKDRIVRESTVEHFVGIDPYGPTYSGVTMQQLENISAPMLQSQVENWWNYRLKNECRPAGANLIALGFELHEAASFLLTAPDSNDRTNFLMAHSQALLLSCTLKLKSIHEKIGAYPFTFKAPTDPFGNGKPLIYWPIGKTYRLYSVGPDGVDDGKTTSLSRFQERWPGDVIPPLLETGIG